MKTTKHTERQSSVVAHRICVSLFIIVLVSIFGYLVPSLAQSAEGNLQWAKQKHCKRIAVEAIFEFLHACGSHVLFHSHSCNITDPAFVQIAGGLMVYSMVLRPGVKGSKCNHSRNTTPEAIGFL